MLSKLLPQVRCTSFPLVKRSIVTLWFILLASVSIAEDPKLERRSGTLWVLLIFHPCESAERSLAHELTTALSLCVLYYAILPVKPPWLRSTVLAVFALMHAHQRACNQVAKLIFETTVTYRERYCQITSKFIYKYRQQSLMEHSAALKLLTVGRNCLPV